MDQAVVCVPAAPLTPRPAAHESLSDEVLYGMQVTLLGNAPPGWRHIRTSYRYEGFVPASALVEGPLAEAWDALPKHTVCRSFCDVLSAPSIQSRPILTLPRGALVHLRQCGEFSEISLCDGQIGYCKSNFLVPQVTVRPAETEFRHGVVETALSYLGTPYRWGGKTPVGIDCSGLCSLSYLIHGAIIFRDAKLSPDFALHAIEAHEACPGDLLFFPGHMALYLGEGRYVHSTAFLGSEGVVLGSLLPGVPGYRADLADSLLTFASLF